VIIGSMGLLKDKLLLLLQWLVSFQMCFFKWR